jgi:hypothetical protein
MALVFEQQGRESNKAFAAFRAYLELGPQRSLAAVGQKLGKSKVLMERWSAKYDWPARVQAYMATVAEQERLAIEVRAVEKAVEWEKMQEGVKREAWKEAEETIEMVRQARKEWMESGRTPGWEGMARMLELAFKLKQLATGLGDGDKRAATDSPAVRVEVNVALAKIYGEVEARPANQAEVVDVEGKPV